ncbi:MAG: hypothetical protein M1839_008215 [Geoglossum umbratile]|nr:MAG: hypothetical protein M1839_008215 [Geoglossum umbratile]
MTKTLVTGANGFVAAHAIDALVKQGHTVVGSVRRDIYGDQLLSIHPEWKDQVSFINVSDYTKEGTWDEAFKAGDLDYALHIAAPMPSPKNTDFDRDFLEPNVKGGTFPYPTVSSRPIPQPERFTFPSPSSSPKEAVPTPNPNPNSNLELLKSATKYGKALKSIVVTGSINSLTYGTADQVTDRVYTSKDYLPTTIEEARAANHYFISYSTAKKYSEQALWAYVEKEKPHYSVTVFLPCLVFGPPIHYVSDIKSINYTSDIIYSFFNGTSDTTPPTSFPGYIDVRDLITHHILALTTPAARNKRFLLGDLRYTSALTASVLRRLPELRGRVAANDSDDNTPPLLRQDVRDTEAVFGKPTRSADDTFGDAARRILALERELAMGK